MSRKIFAVVLVFLCFAPGAIALIPSTNAAPALSSEPAARSLTPHDPIYINGNDQFTEANGVSAGNGTAENPYVIENWDISSTIYYGISVSNTNVHFIIRNCVIHCASSKVGIWTYYSSNSTITNCSFYDNLRGIELAYSFNSIVSNCSAYNNSDYGIGLYQFSNCSITNCVSYNNLGGGIYVDESPDTRIINCIVYNNSGYSSGIRLDSSPNSTVINCNIYNNADWGIFLFLSNNVTISYCTIHNNSYGVSFDGSSNNIILCCSLYNNSVNGVNTGDIYTGFFSNNNTFYHNNFVNNAQNAYDKRINSWDNGAEGNYWSDYTGLDTDGDGIGDDPYYIPGGSNADNFPLMFPYPTKPNVKASNLTLKSTAQGVKISANISNTDASSDQSNLNVGFFVNASNINTQQINLPRNSTQTVFTYWQAPVGKYTIKVKADPENLVKEINELDNEISTYIELSDVAVATEDITAAVVQNGIQLNVTLHNPGPALIGAPTYIYIDSKLEHQELVGVPAQGSNNVSFVWNGPSGYHGVLVVVDPENIFIEADETNNNATMTIYMLTGAPDLSIISTDIYFNPSTPVEGRNTTVTAIVHNIGYANASTATITFYDNDNIIYTAALPAIQQDGQYPVSTTFAAYNGHTIKVELTTTGIEYNLGNNYATAELNTVLPDLYIDGKNITITPSKPVEGGSTSITAKIYNMGEGTGEATVQFFADSNLIGEKQTGEISPGLSADVTIIWNNTTAGAIISVKILPSYPDAHSWNNEAEILMGETKTYNLIPKNITFSPDPPIQNQSTTVSVEIWNTGEASSPNAVISFYDGVVLISNESIGPVPMGEYLNVSTTWAHAQKEHTVYVKIDISPYTASKLLLTTKMPDLTISNITFSEQYPENNKTILISITVKNQGNATSEQAELKVYAGDALLQVITIAPLPAGASDTKEVSWQAQNLVRIKAEFTTSIDADTGNNFLDLLSPETTPPQQKTIPAEQVISLGGAIITALVGLSIYYKRYAIFSLLAPLQHRFLTKEKIISTPLRRQILAILEENPGSNTFSLVKMTNKHYNAIDYNLKLLKEFQLVKMIDTGYDKKYYLETQYTGLEPTPEIERKIIDVVFLNPRSSPTEVAKIIDPTADENFIQMVRRKLRDLEIRGIFTAQYDGDIPKYSFAYPRSAVK